MFHGAHAWSAPREGHPASGAGARGQRPPEPRARVDAGLARPDTRISVHHELLPDFMSSTSMFHVLWEALEQGLTVEFVERARGASTTLSRAPSDSKLVSLKAKTSRKDTQVLTEAAKRSLMDLTERGGATEAWIHGRGDSRRAVRRRVGWSTFDVKQ